MLTSADRRNRGVARKHRQAGREVQDHPRRWAGASARMREDRQTSPGPSTRPSGRVRPRASGLSDPAESTAYARCCRAPAVKETTAHRSGQGDSSCAADCRRWEHAPSALSDVVRRWRAAVSCAGRRWRLAACQGASLSCRAVCRRARRDRIRYSEAARRRQRTCGPCCLCALTAAPGSGQSRLCGRCRWTAATGAGSPHHRRQRRCARARSTRPTKSGSAARACRWGNAGRLARQE